MARNTAWPTSILGNFCTKEHVEFVQTVQGSPQTVVFVGLKQNLEKNIDSYLSQKLVEELDVRKGLLKRLKPQRDAPVTTETIVFGEGAHSHRVVFVGLPTDCSRHNCYARPHAIHTALKGLSLDYPATVVLALDDAKWARSAGAAVARAFPSYSHKSTAGGYGDNKVHVMFDIVTGDKVDAETIDEMNNLGTSVRMAAALLDMPTSELNTNRFVEVARSVAEEVKASKVTIISGTDLRDQGFGGLWGVGKASEHLPALVVLEHIPAHMSGDEPSICMVGKGIVYDTGGLSIKGKTTMPGMKGDMGGAAGILGAFRAHVLNGGNKRRVCALLCLAENSVSKESTRPDDVLEMYSGKTVEVNNTDAEGRLVLGDGVAYCVKHLNPEYIIDMATLTGAQGVATGQNHGAIYCNNDELETLAIATGKATGDLVHPLPFAPEFYRKEFASSVADMKNSVADRANAQSSCAGQFIGNHLGDFLYNGKWLHIDMASPAHRGPRGTGYGVALLAGLLNELK